MPVPVLYENIMQDISAELEDPRFEGRIHGMRSAAMQGGCYGPLCRKFHRDRERVKRSKRLGRNIPPVDPAGEAFLAKIIRTHAERITLERLYEQLDSVS